MCTLLESSKYISGIDNKRIKSVSKMILISFENKLNVDWLVNGFYLVIGFYLSISFDWLIWGF